MLLVVEKIDESSKNVGRRFRRKPLGSGSSKILNAKQFQENLPNKQAGREEINLQTFLSIHVKYFSVRFFCGSSWSSRGISASHWRYLVGLQKNCPTASLDKNYVEFQTDQNYNVDLRRTFLALNMEFVKGRGNGTKNSKQGKNEHKEKTQADEEMEEQEKVPFTPVTHVDNILNSILSNVELCIIFKKVYNLNGLYAHKFYVSNVLKAAISECKGVLHSER